MRRFDLSAVFHGHWKSLAASGGWRDARLIFIGLPGALLALGIGFEWLLPAPGAMLTGVSLLIGGALTVFAQLVGLRSRLRTDLDEDWVEGEFDALDETVNHLLMAVLVAVLAAVLLVSYMSVPATTPVASVLAAGALASCCYLVLLLVVCVPRLYYSYISAFNPSARVNGHHRTFIR